jgi:dTDP-4-dehydrorhamnose 3,5-epimerase
MESTLIPAEIFSDQRGSIGFVNEENPGFYRRFYLISHPDTQVVRAWQGHIKEEKAFYVIKGDFIIAVLHPGNFESPGDDEIPKTFYLYSKNKNLLRVPGGNYTGIKALSPNSVLLVLSSMNVTDSKKDDYRQPATRWMNWDSIK